MLSDSRLGFGLMRLPKDENGVIQVERVCEMVDAYLASGLTYFDTAYVYGGSEEAIRKALVERHPRESYTLANKLPGWKLTCEEDNEKIFNESLARCGVDYFDFYLIHSIEKGNIDAYRNYKTFEFVKKMKEEGKVKHIGFSFHDSPELLDEVLTEHPELEFVQLQLNYIDWENPIICSRRNYEVARKHGKPIVVMEPVKGGKLAGFTEEINKVYTDYAPEKSIASWALRFIMSKEGVMTVLSGMSDEAQMKDNLATAVNFQPVNETESQLIQKVTDMVLNIETIPCTGCSYCTEGCPMSINIPHLFKAYNSFKTYGKSGRYVTYYNDHAKAPNSPANACIECGQCEGVCPQHLPVIDLLKQVSEVFDN